MTTSEINKKYLKKLMIFFFTNNVLSSVQKYVRNKAMTTSETNKKILGKCFFTHQKNALEMTLALSTGFGRCFSLESVESMFVFLYYTMFTQLNCLSQLF